MHRFPVCCLYILPPLHPTFGLCPDFVCRRPFGHDFFSQDPATNPFSASYKIPQGGSSCEAALNSPPVHDGWRLLGLAGLMGPLVVKRVENHLSRILSLM